MVGQQRQRLQQQPTVRRVLQAVARLQRVHDQVPHDGDRGHHIRGVDLDGENLPVMENILRADLPASEERICRVSLVRNFYSGVFILFWARSTEMVGVRLMNNSQTIKSLMYS